MNETVELTPELAARFVIFQKHYKTFVLMQDSGVFDIGHGKAVFNFANGVLQNIVKEELVYKR